MISNLKLELEHFPHIVESSSLHFRHGIKQLLKQCTHLQVPLVVVSAAINDVVESAVDCIVNETEHAQRDIVHVIAN